MVVLNADDEVDGRSKLLGNPLGDGLMWKDIDIGPDAPLPEKDQVS